MRRAAIPIAACVAALAACERGPASAPAGAPDPTSMPTASPTAIATSTPAPVPTPRTPATAILRAAVAVEPGAARVPLAPGAESVVDPAATFEVELSARSPDARLVLVDAREDHVPATSTRELAAGTRLTLTPSAPLVPGSRYALRLDGAVDRELHDEAGRGYGPVTLPLLAAGSPPPPEPKKPARKKNRR